jgi:hypothetical protein
MCIGHYFFGYLEFLVKNLLVIAAFAAVNIGSASGKDSSGIICDSARGVGSFTPPNGQTTVPTVAEIRALPLPANFNINAIPICEDVKIRGASQTNGMGAASFSISSPLPYGIDLTLNLENAVSLPVDETIVVAQIDLGHSGGNSDPNQLSVYATNTNEGLVFQAYVWSGYNQRMYHAASAYDTSGGNGAVNIGITWNGPLLFGTYRQMTVGFGGASQQTTSNLVPLGRFDRVDHLTIGSIIPTNALTQSAQPGTTPPSIAIRAAVRR